MAILFDFNGTMFFDEGFQEKSWCTFLEKKIGRAGEGKKYNVNKYLDLKLGLSINMSI